MEHGHHGHHNHHNHHDSNHGMKEHQHDTKLDPTSAMADADVHKNHGLHHGGHHPTTTASPFSVSTVMESLFGSQHDTHNVHNHHHHHHDMAIHEQSTSAPMIPGDPDIHHGHHGHHTLEPLLDDVTVKSHDHLHLHSGSADITHDSRHMFHPAGSKDAEVHASSTGIHHGHGSNHGHGSHHGHGSQHGGHGHDAQHGGHGSGHMKMVFSTQTSVPLLFEGWPTDTVCGLTLALVGSCLLAVVYEGILAYFIHLPSSNQPKTQKHKLLAAMLHMVRVAMGYILMLCAMTYNLWILLVIVLGAGLGHFFVRPLISHLLRKKRKKTRAKGGKGDSSQPMLKGNNNCCDNREESVQHKNGHVENTKLVVDSETVL